MTDAALGFGALVSPRGRVVPVVTVVAVLIVTWYALAVLLNWPQVTAMMANSSQTGTTTEIIGATWSMERPVLPAPHQVIAEFWKTTVDTAPTSKRSLLYHAWITASATMLGFAFGAILGMLLAAGVVHVKTLDRSLMPWIIASQTVPILAIAPMVIVILGSIGMVGLVPKAIIAMYLCFFPVTIGMVKGLRSPEANHLDLMRTYNSSPSQVLWKLRFPASVPFLFASMKVAIAASLVGAIVGELPTGAVAGIGAKLLSGSYYSQTIDIFAALVAGSVVAVLLVTAVGIAGRITERAMGARPA